MSYEVDYTKECKCPCGMGTVEYVLESNDWLQTREHINIKCQECNTKYRVESKYFCPKPKHDYTIYYLVPTDRNLSADEVKKGTLKLDF